MTLPLMSPLEEMSQRRVRMINSMAGVHCRVFEDNSGALNITHTGISGSTWSKGNIKYQIC